MLCEEGAYSVRRWVGVCTGALKLLPYQRHIPIQPILWEYIRRTLDLECNAMLKTSRTECNNRHVTKHSNRDFLDLLESEQVL